MSETQCKRTTEYFCKKGQIPCLIENKIVKKTTYYSATHPDYKIIIIEIKYIFPMKWP